MLELQFFMLNHLRLVDQVILCNHLEVNVYDFRRFLLPEGILKSIVNYFNKVIPPIHGVACRGSPPKRRFRGEVA